ncbi:HNH endonuclease, partial [Vibrio anguillarum]
MKAFLAEHYPVAPAADWVEKFNQTFGTKKSKAALVSSCKRFGIKSGRNGQFYKGMVPPNKGKPHPSRGRSRETLFGGVRGHKPDNKKPIGSTRICSKDGYLVVKVGEPSVWKHAHVHLWEANNGKVPTGFVVRFYDNSPDKLKSPTLDNLFLVSRPVHCRLTQMKLCDIPMEHKDTAIL